MVIEHRIRRLVESHEAEWVDPDPERILGFWAKAVATLHDSRTGLSPDNAVTLGYQAAMQATAVLHSAGIRIKGSAGGHHQRTFYALAALELAGLAKVDVQSEAISGFARSRPPPAGLRQSPVNVE